MNEQRRSPAALFFAVSALLALGLALAYWLGRQDGWQIRDRQAAAEEAALIEAAKQMKRLLGAEGQERGG